MSTLGPYTNDQLKEILDSLISSEVGYPDFIMDDLIAALCPDGHTLEVKEVLSYMGGKEYSCLCSICETRVWYIGPWKRQDTKYRYIDETVTPSTFTYFNPNDENDPKKVELT